MSTTFADTEFGESSCYHSFPIPGNRTSETQPFSFYARLRSYCNFFFFSFQNFKKKIRFDRKSRSSKETSGQRLQWMLFDPHHQFKFMKGWALTTTVSPVPLILSNLILWGLFLSTVTIDFRVDTKTQNSLWNSRLRRAVSAQKTAALLLPYHKIFVLRALRLGWSVFLNMLWR